MLTIIGCGNTLRQDDGVGVVVAQRLAARLRTRPLPRVRAFACATTGFEVFSRARDSLALWLIDAGQCGSAPGTIHELSGDAVIRRRPPSVNLHGLRWDHALALGQAMYPDTFPKHVRVILVEAAELGYGEGLSAQVAQAAERVYQRVLHDAEQHAAAGPSRMARERP